MSNFYFLPVLFAVFSNFNTDSHNVQRVIGCRLCIYDCNPKNLTRSFYIRKDFNCLKNASLTLLEPSFRSFTRKISKLELYLEFRYRNFGASQCTESFFFGTVFYCIFRYSSIFCDSRSIHPFGMLFCFRCVRYIYRKKDSALGTLVLPALNTTVRLDRTGVSGTSGMNKS